jgi:acetyl esterase/lipase
MHPAMAVRTKRAGFLAVAVLIGVLAGSSIGPAAGSAPAATTVAQTAPDEPNLTTDDIIEWLPEAPADHRIRYGSDPLQWGDLRLPDGPGPHPVVVFIHGGGWSSNWNHDHSDRLVEAFTNAGVATWSLEYRRLGNNGGGWPGTFLDVANGADHLRVLADQHEFPLDLTRVVAVGHSAGGHLALWLAGRDNLPADSDLYVPDPLPLRGVVALAGVPDLERFAELEEQWATVFAELLGAESDEELLAQRYEQASARPLLPLGEPQWLIQGDEDSSVPVTVPTEYAELAREAGDDVRVTILEGAGHFELIDPWSSAWPTVSGAVLTLLGPLPEE